MEEVCSVVSIYTISRSLPFRSSSGDDVTKVRSSIDFIVNLCRRQ